jgi:hypothetical protein
LKLEFSVGVLEAVAGSVWCFGRYFCVFCVTFYVVMRDV